MGEKIDILNRKKILDNIYMIIENLAGSGRGCTFAIDGVWGSGKTFILDKLEKRIELVQSEATSDDKFLVFNYNCWMYDYYREPSVAIISSMLDNVSEKCHIFNSSQMNTISAGWKKAKEILAKVADQFIENKIGFGLVKTINDIQDNSQQIELDQNSYDMMFKFKETLNKARKQLSDLAKQNNIVFIVDELDRCLPEYAMKVLERLHHMFAGIDNIIVIIAIDSRQLENSIKKIYGENIDVKRYLSKFISFNLRLDNGEIRNSFLNKYEAYISKFKDLSEAEQKLLMGVVSNIFSEIDIRTQENLIENINMVHSIVCDAQADISILLFELFWIIIKHRLGTPDFSLIFNFNGYSHFESRLTKKFIDYLKDIEKNIGGGSKIHTGQTNYRVGGETPIDLMFCYFQCILLHREEITDIKYYYQNKDFYTGNIDLAMKFDEMARSIC